MPRPRPPVHNLPPKSACWRLLVCHAESRNIKFPSSHFILVNSPFLHEQEGTGNSARDPRWISEPLNLNKIKLFLAVRSFESKQASEQIMRTVWSTLKKKKDNFPYFYSFPTFFLTDAILKTRTKSHTYQFQIVNLSLLLRSISHPAMANSPNAWHGQILPLHVWNTSRRKWPSYIL